MPLSKEIQNLQEMRESPGWSVYRDLVTGKSNPIEHIPGFEEHQTLFMTLIKDLRAATRAGEAIKAAGYSGQLDLLERILDVPKDVVDKAMGKTSPKDTFFDSSDSFISADTAHY